jgi:peptidoglycan/LPS O-acetylase OafA/YrhL
MPDTNSALAAPASTRRVTTLGRGSRLGWVDALKGLALIWIFLNHAVERLLGCAHFCNPVPDWPPLIERVRQLAPVGGYGLWDIPLNVFRYAGWTGDQGVQLFLIASGFALTWGLLDRGAGPAIRPGEFFLKRALRLYPAWWAMHVVVLVLWILGDEPLGKSFLLSAAGIRFTRGTFYLFSPSWWFVGLLIQLYFLYPFLWKLLRRWGGQRLLWGSLVLCVAARALGLAFLKDQMDPWLRGTVFVTRLPEFVLGMLLASSMHGSPDATDRWLRAPRQILLSLALYLAGTALGLTWAGMTVSPFLLGAGALGLLYPLLAGGRDSGGAVLRWIGAHSYSLYLVHHPLMNLLVPDLPPRVTGVEALRLLAAAGATVGAGLLLERTVSAAEALVARWYVRGGLRGVAWRAAGILAMVVAAILGLDRLSRRLDPMEIYGWGERASLEADDRFGWKLRPSCVTRLRWQDYDYRVTANALGFPGPDYPAAKAPGTLRILVTGDAFSSAEGVDTDDAWPRRLERQLAERRPSSRIEVLNFAITGYGPSQYARVIREFAPLFHPDLILVELYVNDFEDVLRSDELTRQEIDFGGPDPDGLRAIVRAENLRAWNRSRILTPFRAAVLGRPNPDALFMRGVEYLTLAQQDWWTQGRDQLAERIARIKATADQVGARVAVLMVPAAVQVCSGEGLDFFPRPLDLSDRSRYDLELPQRLARKIVADLELAFLDLRDALKTSTAGTYQRRNMHWTVLGHQIAAEYVTAKVLDESLRLLPPRGR